jgi:hypothetical protein
MKEKGKHKKKKKKKKKKKGFTKQFLFNLTTDKQVSVFSKPTNTPSFFQK